MQYHSNILVHEHIVQNNLKKLFTTYSKYNGESNGPKCDSWGTPGLSS